MAKRKVNSIETLVSQALIDMKISHEEFVTILKEKDKYDRNVRNVSGKLEEKQDNTRLNSLISRTKKEK